MTTPDVAFFEALELRRTQALVHGNSKVFQQLHADDYELVTPAGRTLSRVEYLRLITEAPFYTDWKMGTIRARIDSALTVLRYPATLSFASGQTIEVWHTDVYERRAGHWQAVWAQATERSASALPIEDSGKLSGAVFRE